MQKWSQKYIFTGGASDQCHVNQWRLQNGAIFIVNYNGPITDPCGTPSRRISGLEFVLNFVICHS